MDAAGTYDMNEMVQFVYKNRDVAKFIELKSTEAAKLANAEDSLARETDPDMVPIWEQDIRERRDKIEDLEEHIRGMLSLGGAKSRRSKPKSRSGSRSRSRSRSNKSGSRSRSRSRRSNGRRRAGSRRRR